MRTVPRRLRQKTLELCFTVALGVLFGVPTVAIAQDRLPNAGKLHRVMQVGDDV